MQRNSFFVFIQSPGAVTPVPWVNNAPGFSGFPEPTLSVLRQAWQQFVDSGEELKIIADPEPIPAIVAPGWNGFYDALMVSQTYNFLFAETVSHPSISGAMAAMGVALLKGESDPLNPDRLAALQASVSAVLGVLAVVGISLSNEQIAEIRTLFDDNGFTSIQLE